MTVDTLNGIDIAFTSAGQPQAPAVLMIMGLGASHRLWPEALVNNIIDAGYRVVLLDNRDTGESATLEELGDPLLWWTFIKLRLGFDLDAPYTLSDMAADAVAVLDRLDIDAAHVVGASMGGMIAQVLSAEHPDRVLTLTSIMSTTGARHLPEASSNGNTMY